MTRFPLSRRLTVLAILFASRAAAQAVPAFTCAANAGVPPTVRAEGLTELVGDLLLNCTGGTPTPPGAPVPVFNLQIGLNTNITNQLINGSPDALLLIGDPAGSNQSFCTGGQSCSITGVGGSSGINYTLPNSPANSGQPVRNVYQGRAVNPNSIVWLGVPVDPPGTTVTRIIRITNVRANASQLGVSNTLIPNQISMFISATGMTQVPIGNPRQTVGTILPGFTYPFTPQGPENPEPTQVTGAQTFPSCTDHYRDLATDPNRIPPARDFSLRFREGFASSFKVRGTTSQTTPGAGAVSNTEAGLTNTAFPDIGTANSGTRLRAIFAGVPQNVRIFVGGTQDPSGSTATARARAVTSGSGPAEPATLQPNGLVEVRITDGRGSIYWEVIGSNRTGIETFTFPGYISFTGSAASPSGTIATLLGFTPSGLLPPNRDTSSTDIPTFFEDLDPLAAALRTMAAARLESCGTANPALQVAITPAFQNTFTVSAESPIRSLNFFLSSVGTSRPVNVTPVLIGSPQSLRQVTRGWLTVVQSQATTPMTVSVQANAAGLAPGEYTGGVRLESPGTPPLLNQVPVRMVILPPGPRFTPNGVVDAGSYYSGAVAPGQAIVVFGSSFGPPQLAGLTLNPEGRVATSAGETRVLFDNTPAPMIYAASGQVSAVVPFGVAQSFRTAMQVEYRGVRSSQVFLPVLPALPGLFTADSSGFGQGAILNQDGTPNSRANPASPGDVIVIFGSGAGQTDPPGVDGRLAGAPLPTLVQPFTVMIDGRPAEVLYAGPAPGLVEGVFQANARIPADLAGGRSVEVSVTAGNVRSQAGVLVAVR